METGHGIKYRQLHIEDYLREIPAEQGRETGEYAHERITGNPDTNTDFRTDNLLDTILRSDNLNAAYKKVKTNKGVGGIDGMQVDELLPYLREHQSELVEQVREGKYKPNPVRRVEIPKEEKGKTRKLGIPTVVDRVIQQAIAQELTPLYEEQFSDNSIGFRPGRGAHDALERCRKYINEGSVEDGEGREGNLADTQVPESRSNGGRRISRNDRGRAAGRPAKSLMWKCHAE